MASRQIFLVAQQRFCDNAAGVLFESGRYCKRAPGPDGTTINSDVGRAEAGSVNGEALDATSVIDSGCSGCHGLAATVAAGGGDADDVGEEQCTRAVVGKNAAASISRDRLLPRVLRSTRTIRANGRAWGASDRTRRVREQVWASSAWRLGPDDNGCASATTTTDCGDGSQGRVASGTPESSEAAIATLTAIVAGDTAARGRPRTAAAFPDAAGREKTAVAEAWLEAAAAVAQDAATPTASSHLTIAHPTAAPSGSALDLLRTDDAAERQQKRVVRELVEALAATCDSRHAHATFIRGKCPHA
jgi:hypothetical protein